MTTWTAWRQALVVLVKEFVDSCRDRRALVSVVLTVLIGPVITGFMMNRMADRQRAAEEVRIPVVGVQYAPALVEWLRQQSGVEIVGAPDNPEQAVRDQDEYVVAIIPKDFAERFRASKPATVKLVADSARADTYPQVNRVRRLFEQYGAQIGSLRLVGRGVSPAVATPLQVQEVEVSTTQQRAARLLAVIPLMILLSAFTGAMQIATDATAGERERGSLEALLVNPVPRSALAVGKCLAAAAAAMLAVTV
ncbi:MAG TPA: ABC transporter permease subunit, partial [Vicinamibacterales bacterium]